MLEDGGMVAELMKTTSLIWMTTTSLIWMTRCKYVCVYIVPYTSYIWLEFYLLLVHLKKFSGHLFIGS